VDEFLFIALFIFGALWTWRTIRSVDVRRLRFEDGLVFGLTFYIVVPAVFLMFVGEIKNYELNTVPYRPFEDVDTSANIFLGWMCILTFHGLRRALFAPPSRTSDDFRPADLFLFCMLYASMTLITFILSGRAEGGHWQQKLGVGFSNSTVLILIGNFSNVYRTAVFGILFFAYVRGTLRPGAIVILGGCIVAFDFALTFNRITAVYYTIMLMLMYRKQFILFCAGLLVAAPLLGYFSTVWSIFRAYALRTGYNLDGLINALEIASMTAPSGEQQLDKLLNSLFESSNLLVYNYIVQHIGGSFPVLWGQTFIGRSLTFLVPSTVWPDKPGVFGNLLGQYIEGEPTLSLNSTLFGEALANFYYFWPFALIAMLLIVSEIYRRFTRISPFAGYFGCFVAIALWRFDMAFAFVAMVAFLSFEVMRRLMHIILLPLLARVPASRQPAVVTGHHRRLIQRTGQDPRRKTWK
jgi:hypothetical protein